jgi:hypothetical protein
MTRSMVLSALLYLLPLGCEVATAAELDDAGMTEVLAALEEAGAREPEAVQLGSEVLTGDVRPAEAQPPPGYVEMMAQARSGPSFGNAVLLLEPNEEIVVPIFIGGTEALSIQLRLEKRRFSRPLTHDLLDQMLSKLGAKMLRAQVDALEDSVYIGTVVLKQGAQVLSFDARPSDAIALAVGNAVPIFVSRKLLDEAGIRADQLDDERPQKAANPVAL